MVQITFSKLLFLQIKKKTVHTTEISNNTEIPTTKLASETALTVRRVGKAGHLLVMSENFMRLVTYLKSP